MLYLPLSQWISLAVLDRDALARGDRLQPVRVEERRQMRGTHESVWRTAIFDVSGLPEGTVLTVTRVGGRWCERAFAVRGGEAIEIPESDAEDLLDPAGARRQAWWRRVVRSRVPKNTYRFVMHEGHGFEPETVYDWGGQTSVAVCVRAGPVYVWIRAVTYDEACELGLI